VPVDVPAYAAPDLTSDPVVYPYPPDGVQNVANLLSDDTGVSLVVETSRFYDMPGQETYHYWNTNRVYRASSLDGLFDTGGVVIPDETKVVISGWGDERVVHNQAAPCGILSQNRMMVASVEPLVYEGSWNPINQEWSYHLVGGGGLVFNILAVNSPYARAHEQIDIYTGLGHRSPAIARHPLTWRLYVSAHFTSGETPWLYSSSDGGLSWIHLGIEDGGVNGLGTGVLMGNWSNRFANLYCDRDYLWMVTYREGATAGAQGQCILYQFRHDPFLRLPVLFPGELALHLVQQGTVIEPPPGGGHTYSGIVIGPADEGRPAIVRDPLTWQLTVIVPKTTEWDDTTLPTPGIVEYTSNDTGVTWTQKGSHGC
jgi:hypothetical protein